MRLSLAFESAIAGGSISLLDGDVEMDHWIGSDEVSRAEDLLANIDKLLNRNSRSRHDIGLIAVSAGPGSFTGIRIGLSTAIGLKIGLGVPMVQVSALESVASAPDHQDCVVAVPMGRKSVCAQLFAHGRATGGPRTIGSDEFLDVLRQDTLNKYVVHEMLYPSEIRLGHVVSFGSNIANAVGVYAIKNPNAAVEPLFISKSAK